MPQPMVRHLARRAMQVALLAAGIVVVLLVFSRQAHAATTVTSASATSAATTPVSSAATAPATSAPAGPRER